MAIFRPLMNHKLLLLNKIFRSLPLFLLFIVSTIQSQDLFYSDNLVMSSLKRRDVIPLVQINNPYAFMRRRYFNSNAVPDLKFRRSKDIRNSPPLDRTFELTESQIREAKIAENQENLEKLENELRWLTIDTDEGIGQQPTLMYIGQ